MEYQEIEIKSDQDMLRAKEKYGDSGLYVEAGGKIQPYYYVTASTVDHQDYLWHIKK